MGKSIGSDQEGSGSDLWMCGRRDEGIWAGLEARPEVQYHKKGFRVWAGAGRLVLKPNGKRFNFADSVTSLGCLACSVDSGPGPLSGSNAGSWPLMGSSVGLKGSLEVMADRHVSLDTMYKTGGFQYDGSTPPWSQLLDHSQTSPRPCLPVGDNSFYSLVDREWRNPRVPLLSHLFHPDSERSLSNEH